jgi:hypothetical protein
VAVKIMAGVIFSEMPYTAYYRLWEAVEPPVDYDENYPESEIEKILTEQENPFQKTIKAYKLFRTTKSQPGKIFPLFVDADQPVPVGQWVQAKAGAPAGGGKVKSKLGPLAYRPGWHAGDLPIATHIGGKSRKGQKKPDHRPDHQVWAEIEVPDDKDWQSVANSRARIMKNGKRHAGSAHITDQVPLGGHYRYKTNPNMTGNWVISGNMKVNRMLSKDEVKRINDAHGVADLPPPEDLPEPQLGQASAQWKRRTKAI